MNRTTEQQNNRTTEQQNNNILSISCYFVKQLFAAIKNCFIYIKRENDTK